MSNTDVTQGEDGDTNRDRRLEVFGGNIYSGSGNDKFTLIDCDFHGNYAAEDGDGAGGLFHFGGRPNNHSKSRTQIGTNQFKTATIGFPTITLSQEHKLIRIFTLRQMLEQPKKSFQSPSSLTCILFFALSQIDQKFRGNWFALPIHHNKIHELCRIQ